MLSLIKTCLNLLIEIMSMLILVRCIVSWLPFGRDNKIIDFLYQVTEPLMAPARRLLAKTPLGQGGLMIDFSPILVLLVLDFVIRPLINLL